MEEKEEEFIDILGQAEKQQEKKPVVAERILKP